ncbi:hypothetical protein H7J87_12340 [Mycolicibacterium wolinskyi]|nr:MULTISPECIES: hypothetical protein [Mycolicibacterium]MCV7286117.1 hypothetical protein [Mycolicibacterium wolinskyi]MCV7296313.1 hypothetical protein [Mycolicibacterium goodii]
MTGLVNELGAPRGRRYADLATLTRAEPRAQRRRAAETGDIDEGMPA